MTAIGAALDGAAPAPRLADEGDQRPFGGRDDDDGLDAPSLPPECPVKPLGLGIDGQTCWYLNMLGQLVALGPRDHGKSNLNMLFTPRTHLLSKYWPRWSEPKYEGRGNARKLVKESEIVGFAQDDASEALIASCGKSGIFDAQGRVRGRGTHRGNAGALILHTGDQVMTADRSMLGLPKAAEWHSPGLIDGFVYPAAAPAPRPWHEKVGTAEGETLLALLGTWNMARGELDAQLALGFVMQGFICGAMDWRSHLYVTGGKGTGKSTLNGKGGLFDRLFGKGVLRTGNASEAAVRQTLGPQTIPVIFDEFEPNEFNRSKLKAVLELARIASSGNEMHRGGQDHRAREFTLRSAFQFSSILVPEMAPQDRDRFAIIELRPLGDDTAALDLDAGMLVGGARLGFGELGQRLMRRAVDGWPRLEAALSAYKGALREAGHTQRAADQFGTLLACADLALYDHEPRPEQLEHWVALTDPRDLVEVADNADEHQELLSHLVTSTVQARGGDERQTIGTWIARAVADEDPAMANRRLGEIGLAIVTPHIKSVDDRGREDWGAKRWQRPAPAFLAVAGKHRALAEILRDTRWEHGSQWSQALKRVVGAVAGVKVKFAVANSQRAVCVPLELVIDPSEIPGRPEWVEAQVERRT